MRIPIHTKHFTGPISENEKLLLKELSNYLEKYLSTGSTPKENEVYLNEKGDVVYKEKDKEPIIGFVKIYLYAIEKLEKGKDAATIEVLGCEAVTLLEALGKRILTLEQNFKEKNKDINCLRLNRLLEEYESKEPNFQNIIQILSPTFQHPELHINAYEYLKNARENPESFRAFAQAFMHPLVGNLIRHLWIFEKYIGPSALYKLPVENISAKDHDEFITRIINRLNQYAESENKLRDITKKVVSFWENPQAGISELNSLKELINTVGRNHAIKIAVFQDSYLNNYKSLYELLKDFSENHNEEQISFKKRMFMSELFHLLDSQQDEMEITISEKHQSEFKTYIKTLLEEDNDRLLSYMLVRMRNDENAKTRKEEVALVLHLINLIDGSKMWDTWEHAKRTFYTMRNTIDTGEIEIFKAMWLKSKEFGDPNWTPSDETIKDVVTTNIKDDTKKEMLKFLFELGAKFSDLKELMNNELVRQAYFECVKSEYEAVSSRCFSSGFPGPAVTVVSFFRDPEFVLEAKNSSTESKEEDKNQKTSGTDPAST